MKTTDIKDYSDNQYNGFVAVHYNIDNTQQDVSIYPNQATIVTDYGEQVDDSGVFNYDSWDGDFMKGTKKMVGASILYQNFLMHLQSNLFD
ncbi:hypothetical protein O3Q49_03585 [Enterococcus lactis]